jgi:type VI secretion system secreted protein Hcp
MFLNRDGVLGYSQHQSMLARRILPFVFCLFAVISARGANDMFLNIAGVPGESRDSNHPGQIDVLAWSWGLSNPSSVTPGGGNSGGIPSIQDISLTKYVDKASPVLMLACSKGTKYSTMTLAMRKSGTIGRDYLVITLTDAIVTSVTNGGSGGDDRFTESIKISFAKVKLEYYEQKPDGSYNTSPVTYNWNLATNSET